MTTENERKFNSNLKELFVDFNKKSSKEQLLELLRKRKLEAANEQSNSTNTEATNG